MTNSAKTKYFIDTSALIRIFRFYPEDLREPIWNKLESMFKSGQLVSHRLVYDEITTTSKNPDVLSEKVKPLKEHFKTLKYGQSILVSDIVKKFPGLIDPSREKEQADPWLIAIAIEDKKEDSDTEIYVVSEESETKPNKIPAVCAHYGIKHLSLEKFYKDIGLSFSVSLNKKE